MKSNCKCSARSDLPTDEQRSPAFPKSRASEAASRLLIPPGSRRQWLTGLLRWGALSAIGVVAATLVRRSSGGPEGGCTRRMPCQRCGSLEGCGLPQAVAWKEGRRK